jgi:hypothetical protein
MKRTRPNAHRLRGLSLLLKRGHCAPTVMGTILGAGRKESSGMIKLVAGLPGGIGNTGGECGGVMSPLVLLGLGAGSDEVRDGLPLVFVRGQAHMRRFAERHSTLFCREIRVEKEQVWPCIKAILNSPGIYASAAADAVPDDGPEERRDAHRLLVAGLRNRGFHCAHAVLDRLPEVASSFPELRGGTACSGLTCGALTAGIMIVGRRLAEIENSYLRVLRMVVLLKMGGDAFADRFNAFNVTMNLGNRMAQWFTGKFGGTQCREITRTDFSSPAGVRYFLDQKASACEGIVAQVAAKVEEILGAAGSA